MALMDYISRRNAKLAKKGQRNSGRSLGKAPAKGSLESLKAGKEKPNSYRRERPATGWKGGAGEVGQGRLTLAPVLKWVGVLCLAVVFFFGTGALLVKGYNFFITCEYFSIKTIEISGNNRLNSREVVEIVELAPGKNSLAVSMEAMEAALARNPWVSGLSIKRTLPDRFEIAITEREPKYWVNRGGVLYYADEAGAPIMPVTAGGFSSLPALEIEEGAEGLAARLPEIARSLVEADLPLDLSSAAWLRLSAGGWLELRPTEKLRVVIGLEGWQGNLAHLNRVLEDLSRRGELRDTAEIRAHGSNVWVSKARS